MTVLSHPHSEKAPGGHVEEPGRDWSGQSQALQPPQFFCFWGFFGLILGLHTRHMEDPRLGAEPELLLLAYVTATATPELSGICDLHHSSQQSQILSPLREVWGQT